MASSKDSFAETNSEPVSPYLLSVEDTETLRHLVHQRLEDCGWCDDIRKMIRGILDKRGVNNVSYEEIAAEIIPKARDLVPDALRKELQLRVRDILETPKTSEK